MLQPIARDSLHSAAEEDLFVQSDDDLCRQVAEVQRLANIKSDLSKHLDWRRGNGSEPFDTDAFSKTYDLYLPAYLALSFSHG